MSLEHFADYVRRHTTSFALVFVLAAAGFLIDEHKAAFPWLIDLQSQALRLMTAADPRVRRADHVTIVEIDDATYRARNLGEPIDRNFLASLVREAGRANAAVVALDLNLVYIPGGPSGDDSSAQKSAVAHLLAAIEQTAHHSPPIPVILAAALQRTSDGQWHELQNALADDALPKVDGAQGVPRRTPIGYASGPSDDRMVPLVIDAPEALPSLSLRTATAYDSALDIVPTAAQKPAIREAIENGEFVYGTFLPASAFLHVSADDVANGKPAALAALNHRIVLIGGTRHDPVTGGFKDEHDTPLGPMIGVYIHANWIEAMLDQRIKRLVPWWIALLVDLVLGMSMVVLSARARTLTDQIFVVVLFAIPIAIAYVAFVDLEYSLDFTLPLLVLMIHLVLDKYREFGRPKEAVENEPLEGAADVA